MTIDLLYPALLRQTLQTTQKRYLGGICFWAVKFNISWCRTSFISRCCFCSTPLVEVGLWPWYIKMGVRLKVPVTLKYRLLTPNKVKKCWKQPKGKKEPVRFPCMGRSICFCTTNCDANWDSQTRAFSLGILEPAPKRAFNRIIPNLLINTTTNSTWKIRIIAV